MERQKGARDKEKSPVTRIIGGIVTIAAYAFGRSFGSVFLWPFFGTLVAWFVAHHLVKTRFQPLVPALAIQGGQLIWLITGLTILLFMPPSQLPVIVGSVAGLIADGLLMTGFILWIALRPGWLAVSLATLYQAGNLAVHWLNFFNRGVTEIDQKGLVMHMILNALIISCLLWGWLKIEKPASTIVPAEHV
jgi:hypothetical protein